MVFTRQKDLYNGIVYYKLRAEFSKLSISLLILGITHLTKDEEQLTTLTFISGWNFPLYLLPSTCVRPQQWKLVGYNTYVPLEHAAMKPR